VTGDAPKYDAAHGYYSPKVEKTIPPEPGGSKELIGELAPLYLGFRNSYPPRDERVHVIRDCEFVSHAVGIRQAPQLRSLRVTCGPKAERISC
jgi:hypothetical protein